MSEIKPVYQWQHSNHNVFPESWWKDCTEEDFKARDNKMQFNVRIMFETTAVIESLRRDNEALQKENAELKSEDEISAAVIEKCCNLLAQIAITLKGDPEEIPRHGYHDLPELVSVLHVENELNKVQMQEMLTAMRRAVLALAFAAETSNAMKDDYNALSAAIAKAVASKNGDSK